MSTRWLAIFATLQIITLAVVVASYFRSDSAPETEDVVQDLQMQLRGVVNHQSELAIFLDRLRLDLQNTLQRLGGGSPAAADATTTETSSELDRTSRVLPDVAFPEAFVALRDLKEVFQVRAAQMADDNHQVAALNEQIKQLHAEISRRGLESLHWVGHEVDLAPYEEDRDSAFIVHLLEEVLPDLTGASAESVFQIARGALIRSTNENDVRAAAAGLLRVAAPDHWSKDVIDVITRGGTRKRDISLRVNLLAMFHQENNAIVPEMCRAFVEDPRQPMALRNKAIEVLSSQDSPMVNPTLRKVVFEDPAPDLKGHALAELYARLKNREREQLEELLKDVIDADESRMQSSVKEKAQQMVQELAESADSASE